MRGGIAIGLGVASVAVVVWLSTRDSSAPSVPDAPREAQVGARGASAGGSHDLEALPAAAISGLVRTWEREVAAGRTVRAVQGGRAFPEVTTGPKGWFEIAGLAPGPRVLLTVDGEEPPIPVEGLQPGESRRVRIFLAGGGPVRVEVVDGEYRPIEGAKVLATRVAAAPGSPDWIPRAAEPPPAAHRATTGADGWASLPPLAGDWLLVARHDGYATGFEQIGNYPGLIIEGNVCRILLRPRADLSGRVMDTAGRPMANVRIYTTGDLEGWFRRESIPWRPRGRTDGNGEYRLAGVPAGRTTIYAARPHGSPVKVGIVHLPRVERFDLILPVGGVLRGRITDAKTGKPVAGVRIVAEVGTYSHGGLLYGSETRSDRSGRYEIRGMPVGPVSQLRVNRDGYVPFEIGLSHDLLMVEGAVVVRDIALVPGAIVSGTVTGPDGPLGGASVSLSYAEPEWREPCSVFADRSGRFRITTLDAGKWTLTAEAAGFFEEEKAIAAVAGGSVSVTFTLEPGTETEPEYREGTSVSPEPTVIRIRGTVRAADGSVPRGARVRVEEVYGSGYGEDPLRWVPDGLKPREDGSFEAEIEKWNAGWRLRVSAGAPGYAPAAPVTISEEAGRAEYRVDVTLGRGHGVTARVTEDASGRPIPGASVCLLVHEGEEAGEEWLTAPPPSAVHAVSDRDGRIEIPNVPAGTYRLCAHSVGTLGGSRVIQVPEDVDVKIALSPALCMGGVVRHPDGASPGPVSVWLRPEGGGDAGSFYSAADGTFFVRGIKVGRYEVEIHRIIGHGPVNFLEREVGVLEAGRTDLVIEVERGYRMAGVVRTEEGVPVPHVFVEVFDAEGDMIGDSEMVGEDGRFEVVGLPEGGYTVKVDEDGFLPFRREGVRAGSADLVLVLSRGRSISGVLVDESGKPLAHHVLAAMDPTSTSRPHRDDPQAATGLNGQFTITGLPEGEHEIRPRSGCEVWVEMKKFEFRFVLLGKTTVAAGTSGVRLVASPGTAVSGLVVDDSGEPIPGAEVVLDQGKFRRDATARADRDGRFRIDHLHPKRVYTVRVKARGRLEARIEDVRPPKEFTVTVKAGLALSGLALSSTGNPLRLWRLDLWGVESGHHYSARTDGKGRFTVSGLRPDSYRVVGRPDSFTDSLELGEVQAGTDGVVLRPR